MENQETNVIENKQYSKIGGWIILYGVGLAVAAVMQGYNGYKSLNILKSEVLNQLTANHYLWPILLKFEFAATIFFAIFAAALIVLLLMKNSYFPKIAIIYMLLNLIYVLIDYFLAKKIPLIAQSDSFEFIKGILQQVVYCGIWIPYLLISKRVKRTFVK